VSHQGSSSFSLIYLTTQTHLVIEEVLFLTMMEVLGFNYLNEFLGNNPTTILEHLALVFGESECT
jgi:hypothetical protein